MGGQNVARNLVTQEPRRDYRHANAAGIPNLSQASHKGHNPGTAYSVKPSGGGTFRLVVWGRVLDTITGPHGGAFPRHHARYVLRFGVTRRVEGGAS